MRSQDPTEQEFKLWEEMKAYDVDELHRQLTSENEMRRFAAAKALQVKGDPHTFEFSVRLTRHDDPKLRAVAAFILGQLGTPGRPFKSKSTSELTILLSDDPVADVRAEAAAAIGHLGPSSAARVLATVANDEDPDVRASVAFALGRMKDERSTKELLRLTYDSNDEVRLWALIGIKPLSSEVSEIRQRVAELLDDPSEEIRVEAASNN